MKDRNEDIGKRIKQARKAKKMTIRKLGELVNLHESTVSRYEKGEIQSLDIEKLKEFADALDVTPAFLMGWDEPEKRENNFKKLREGRNLTLIEISKEIGVDVKTLGDLEKGSIVPMSTIKKVAEYFDVSVENLLNISIHKHRNETDITASLRVIERQKRWNEEIGDVIFSSEEMDELINFVKFMLSKRKKD